MARQIDGRSALLRVDSVIGTARSALSEAIEAAEALSNELASVRQRQAKAWHELAEIQILEADTPEEAAALARLDSEVGELVASHEAYLEQLLADLETAAAEITGLEAARADAAAALDRAIEAYEAKVDEVETALGEDTAYRDLVAAAAEAEAVSERARAKLELARTDMDEKGEIFRSDPLFMYLWKRGYRTPDYKAGNLVRMLDGWVAGLCHYDKSYRNYERLVELPEWLDGHVAAMEAKEGEAETALAEYEAAALRKAGGDALAKAVADERAKLGTLDTRIAEAEARHLEISERQHAAERGEAGPAGEEDDGTAGERAGGDDRAGGLRGAEDEVAGGVRGGGARGSDPPGEREGAVVPRVAGGVAVRHEVHPGGDVVGTEGGDHGARVDGVGRDGGHVAERGVDEATRRQRRSRHARGEAEEAEEDEEGESDEGRGEGKDAGREGARARAGAGRGEGVGGGHGRVTRKEGRRGGRGGAAFCSDMKYLCK